MTQKATGHLGNHAIGIHGHEERISHTTIDMINKDITRQGTGPDGAAYGNKSARFVRQGINNQSVDGSLNVAP